MATGNLGERKQLDRAWTAVATADFQAARYELPASLASFGSGNWSNAAEAALIYAVIDYACGDLDSSVTHARMAQAGLRSQARENLLMASLVIQTLIAFHRRQRDLCESLWQIAAHLPAPSRREQSWQSSIAAISLLASGEFHSSKKQALNALAASQSLPTHELSHVAYLVLGQIARDQGQSEQAADLTKEALTALDGFPYLPLHGELLSLNSHLALDLGRCDAAETVESVAALSSHPFSRPELQDLIDCFEAALRIRTNEITRAKILVDRAEPSSQRTLLSCAIDVESRPSRTAGVLASGKFRWHRHQIETDILRARARRKDPTSAAIQFWRAVERAMDSQSVRPFLDFPLAALTLSDPEFLDVLEQTQPDGAWGESLRDHLEEILRVQKGTSPTGAKSYALSPRELEVLRAVQAGGDFNTIARMLVLSRWTVRGHFYSACRKMGVSGKEGAMAKLNNIEHPRPHCSSS